MRIRTWIFAALVALMLAANLALVSLRIAQTGEDSVRARVALASSALRAQMDLVDARLNPRAVASVPELIEATRPPVDPTVPLGRPDEKALRAAASALQPEPDLLAVAAPQGAIISRRSKPAQQIDDPSAIPMAKMALETSPAPAFVQYEGATYRIAAGRIPGNAAVAIAGTLVDDRFAQQLRSQVDADVTLIQNGKILASSLPQGDDRGRLLKWAAQPGPGYGTLPVRLPLVGFALTGKLPRGTSRVATRGVLVPLDSGVQAALTVPASPYFGWLARYQALYLAGLVLFVIFSFFWGLFARAPKPAAVETPAPAPVPTPEPEPVVRRASPPSLVGADVSDARSAPPAPTRDVPWSPGEGPSGEHPAVPPEPPPVAVIGQLRTPPQPRKIESLDPEVPPPPPPDEPHDPMWSADPFMPTPGQISRSDAEEPALVPLPDSRPLEQREETLPEQAEVVEEQPAEEERESSAAKGDFSFAGLLDEANAAPPSPAPAPKEEEPERTQPGGPSPELLAEARAPAFEEPPKEDYFPGDEPTRIEPVSAALLDKMREKDEELAPPPPPPPPPQPEAAVTMSDFSMPGLEEQDPDLPHWQETYEKFVELKQQLGENPGGLTFEKFSAKLKKNREDLIAKHNAKGVRFLVYEKDGKAAIKASAIR